MKRICKGCGTELLEGGYHSQLRLEDAGIASCRRDVEDPSNDYEITLALSRWNKRVNRPAAVRHLCSVEYVGGAGGPEKLRIAVVIRNAERVLCVYVIRRLHVWRQKWGVKESPEWFAHFSGAQ